MGALLVEWSLRPSPAWHAMLADLAHGGSPTEWRDESRGVRMAVVGSARLVCAEDCVIALEGDVDVPADGGGIAKAYRRGGVSGALRVEGERAFALWDAYERRMVASSDAAGRRAIAYFWEGGTLLLASRALPLLRDPRVPKRWNDLYLAHAALGTWAQRPGSTAFSAIRRTLANEGLVVEQGHLRLVPAPPPDDEPRTAAEAHAAFLGALGRAVQVPTRAGPPCVMLSGGLDSGIVAASAARALGSVDAFSAVAHDAPDERALIEALLLALPSLRCTTVDCSATELDAELPLADDPPTIAVAFSGVRRLLLRAARDAKHRVILDGEGGDELLDVAIRWGDFLGHVTSSPPIEVARAIQQLLRTPSPWRTVLYTALFPRLPPAARRTYLRRAQRRKVARGGWARQLEAIPFGDAVLSDLASSASPRTDGERWRAVFDAIPWVGAAQGRAVQSDAEGIEHRSPLLDGPVRRAVASAPSSARYDARVTKPFLRRAAEGVLPRALLDAPKMEALYDAHALGALSSPLVRGALDGLDEDVGLSPWVDGEAARRARWTCILRGDSARGQDLLRLARLVLWRAAARREYGLP